MAWRRSSVAQKRAYRWSATARRDAPAAALAAQCTAPARRRLAQRLPLQSLLVRRVAAAQHGTGPSVSMCMFAAGLCSNGAQKQSIIANKRKVEQQPRIMDATRRKAASSSEVCDECDLTDDRGARSLTACASVPVANASRTCFPTGQEPPVEVLQTLLAASDRAADARHPRDAKHGHESRTEHLEVATRFSSGLIFRLIRLHTVTKKCVHTP